MVAKPLFLSSVFVDPYPKRVGIRDRVCEMTGGKAAAAVRPVWMGEDFPELFPSSPWPAVDKATFCVDGVREAEIFVAVITERHGSEVDVSGAGTVPTSFFEAELFEAALLEKPAFVFLLEGFNPNPKLASLLKLLAPYFPDMSLRPMSEDAIMREIERLLRYCQRPAWLRRTLPSPKVSAVARTLLSVRHKTYDAQFEAPPLRFLEGLSDPALGAPDPSLVQAVIDRAASAPRNQVQLLLLWFAIRALMGAPFSDPAFAGARRLWSDALGAWAGAGAWYGMHAHTGMGCIAALGSAADLRMRMSPSSEAWREIPHGPLASEYYSLSRVAGRLPDLMELSLRHIQLAIQFGRGNVVDATAIRASIHREMGNLREAIADYEAVERSRRALGGASHGEALSELGYGLLISGAPRRGLSFMEKGVDELRKHAPSGFLVRALKKMAFGYARNRHPFRALDYAVEAHDLAMKLGAYDQIGPLDRLAKRIDRVLPRRSPARKSR